LAKKHVVKHLQKNGDKKNGGGHRRGDRILDQSDGAIAFGAAIAILLIVAGFAYRSSAPSAN
jgi:hypothetical protein